MPPPVNQIPQPRPCGRSLLILVILLVLGLGIVTLRFALQPRFFNDEVEHAHVVWSLTEGIMPFRDIHQNHAPSLWIVSAPLMARLPSCALSMIALRGTALLGIIGGYIIGLFVLREVLGRVNLVAALVMLLLCLAVVPDFEAYRFRPDPLMALFTALAILAAVCIRRAPLWYSVLCGIALGIAASFSPKMSPLCLLVPILCTLECIRARTLRPLWLVIPLGAGFAAGLAPAIIWLVYNDLFFLFWRQTVMDNCHVFNFFSNPDMLASMTETKAVALLALIGALLAVPWKPENANEAWSPGKGLAVAGVLAWLILALEPNHFSYNLQAFAMPGAALGTIAIMRLIEADVWTAARRMAIVAIVLLFVAGRPLMLGVQLEQHGRSIHMAEMQGMINICKSKDATCVAFAPWHPVFCRDATPLYLNWDLYMIVLDWVSPMGKKPYLDKWAHAIPMIEREKPTLIVDNHLWAWARSAKVLDDQSLKRLESFLKAGYDPVKFGNVTAFVRKGTPGIKPIGGQQLKNTVPDQSNESPGL